MSAEYSRGTEGTAILPECRGNKAARKSLSVKTHKRVTNAAGINRQEYLGPCYQEKEVMKNMVVTSAIILVACLGLAVSPAMAAVRFDGLTWYHSEEPSRLLINADGHLEWLNPKAPDQVTVRLPEMDLSDVGDVAQVAYMFKTEGVKTAVPSTDPTLLSGTGDLRVGLFDSNGRGHIKSDNTGYRNKIWCGYLGYCARICPHLPVGIKRKHSDAIPGKFMKRTGAWEEGVCESLVQKAGPYGRSQDLSGFGLELGNFSPLVLQVERTAPQTLVFTVTLNDVTYTYLDDEARYQPKKIDAMAMYFPNPKAYTSIMLAGSCFSGNSMCSSKAVEPKPKKSCGAKLSATDENTAMKNVVVFGRPDVFCGWPANNGVWIWGDEILVGFSYGRYVEKDGHNIGSPSYNVLARSTDGGESWTMEDPENFAGDGGTVVPSPGGINFAHPGFAMRVHRDAGARFFVSYDRGHTWQGPYNFTNLMDHHQLTGLENTARTDYIVNGPADCFIFMSARKPDTGTRDRAFCARTTDGGKTFNFVSWINPEDAGTTRGAMPSTVRITKTKLVTALRRKYPGQWIDVFVSNDNCKSWKFLSKVADTGGWNGNPPALLRLTDGRLCCVYGNRTKRQIIAKYSNDEGASWHKEIILRDDFQADSRDDPDLGYPRLVQRPDGKLVAMYYWATAANPRQHIAATIWDPAKDK